MKNQGYAKTTSKRSDLLTSQQLETYRQTCKKEDRILKEQNKTQLEKLESLLDQKNTYSGMFATDQLWKPKVPSKKEQKEFCQKCVYESVYCKHRQPRNEIKTNYQKPLTSSQVVGWMEPIDNPFYGYQRVAATKEFKDMTHI